MGIPSFSAEALANWEHLTDWAHVLEAAGFDRVLVSEHIAFGMNMAAYSDPGGGGERPAVASPPGRTDPGWNRSPC